MTSSLNNPNIGNTATSAFRSVQLAQPTEGAQIVAPDSAKESRDELDKSSIIFKSAPSLEGPHSSDTRRPIVPPLSIRSLSSPGDLSPRANRDPRPSPRTPRQLHTRKEFQKQRSVYDDDKWKNLRFNSNDTEALRQNYQTRQRALSCAAERRASSGEYQFQKTPRHKAEELSRQFKENPKLIDETIIPQPPTPRNPKTPRELSHYDVTPIPSPNGSPRHILSKDQSPRFEKISGASELLPEDRYNRVQLLKRLSAQNRSERKRIEMTIRQLIGQPILEDKEERKWSVVDQRFRALKGMFERVFVLDRQDKEYDLEVGNALATVKRKTPKLADIPQMKSTEDMHQELLELSKQKRSASERRFSRTYGNFGRQSPIAQHTAIRNSSENLLGLLSSKSSSSEEGSPRAPSSLGVVPGAVGSGYSPRPEEVVNILQSPKTPPRRERTNSQESLPPTPRNPEKSSLSKEDILIPECEVVTATPKRSTSKHGTPRLGGGSKEDLAYLGQSLRQLGINKMRATIGDEPLGKPKRKAKVRSKKTSPERPHRTPSSLG